MSQIKLTYQLSLFAKQITGQVQITLLRAVGSLIAYHGLVHELTLHSLEGIGKSAQCLLYAGSHTRGLHNKGMEEAASDFCVFLQEIGHPLSQLPYGLVGEASQSQACIADTCLCKITCCCYSKLLQMLACCLIMPFTHAAM